MAEPISLTGRARILTKNREIILFQEAATAPPEVEDGFGKAFEMADGATESVLGFFRFPQNARQGLLASVDQWTLEFLSYVRATGVAGNVRMQLELKGIQPTNGIDETTTDTRSLTVAYANVLDTTQRFTFNFASDLWLAADRIMFKLSRLGADGADTWTGTLAVVRAAALKFRALE